MDLSHSSYPSFSYAGARAMVILHDRHLRSFYSTWQRAKAAGLVLPSNPDQDYNSLENVLQHVLGAARGYMIWMCEVLELPNPSIQPVPGETLIEAGAADYINHLCEQWKFPLVTVPEDAFEVEHKSRWNVMYCVDSMLEHAVMHPIRHQFQLEEMMQAK